MSKRLSISNLPRQMTEEQLQTLFSEAGCVVLAKIIPYLHNGQVSGFGFVEMKTKLEGQKAVAMLNDRLVDGRPLAVRHDKRAKTPFGSRSRPNCQR